MAADEFVIVGRLGRTRGVAGDLYVVPETDFPERFIGLKELYVSDRGQFKKYQIDEIGLIGDRPVVRFAGVNNREMAARLTNRELAVPRNEVVPLPEGSHFLFDLEGCNVYDEENGQLVGVVKTVEKYPANDVFVIVADDEIEMRLPAVRQFVKSIDIASKKIVVDQSGMVRS